MISPCHSIKQKTINIVDFSKPGVDEIVSSDINLLGYNKQETETGTQYENVQISIDTLTDVVSDKISTKDEAIIKTSNSGLSLYDSNATLYYTNESISNTVTLNKDLHLVSANSEKAGSFTISSNNIDINGKVVITMQANDAGPLGLYQGLIIKMEDSPKGNYDIFFDAPFKVGEYPTTLRGGLTVYGDNDLYGNTDLRGNATVHNELHVSNTAHFNGDMTYIYKDASLQGNITIGIDDTKSFVINCPTRFKEEVVTTKKLFVGETIESGSTIWADGGLIVWGNAVGKDDSYYNYSIVSRCGLKVERGSTDLYSTLNVSKDAQFLGNVTVANGIKSTTNDIKFLTNDGVHQFGFGLNAQNKPCIKYEKLSGSNRITYEIPFESIISSGS